ncbi:MAG TPA: hypothetical protein VKI44_19945 [Acetobacteraceae bacterium]|nr:hypothetical protein [Acetobacteraceae bacterium]
MAQLIPDFCSFLWDILLNYWGIIAGFVLMAEPVTRFVWHGYDDWAAHWVTRSRRGLLARGAAVVAFVLSNFLAYHSVKTELRLARADTSELQELRQQIAELNRYRWAPLTETEVVALRKSLRDFPHQKIGILYNPSGSDLASSLRDLFHDLGWDASSGPAALLPVEPGIRLSVTDPNLWKVADVIESATGGRLKLTREEPFPLAKEAADVLILIGEKAND